MNERHGSVYVVKYLKACSLAISKVIAQQPFKSLKEIEPDLNLPRLSKSGLPVIIGARDRRSIVQGSTKVIKMYLSLFNIYRIISIPCILKLNTITDPFSGDILYLRMFCSSTQLMLNRVLKRFIGKLDISSHRYLWLETSSTTHSKSWMGLVVDALLIYNNPLLYTHFRDYCEATNSTIITLIDGIGKCFKWQQSVNSLDLNFQSWLFKTFPLIKTNSSFSLGKLSTKEEAAGKMRVFAIVDGWTQSLLYPLHKALFGILRELPNDGTMDQDASFQRCTEKATKFNCCYGYDLSAATDRLPIDVQVSILVTLIGEKAANAWKGLLVSRSYLYRDPESKQINQVQYAVGQPMGALSSWAMLALTHHMIMQYCSWSLNPDSKQWETRYEVLGDDIVIFSKDLASKYLYVMDKLGVPINERKSVVSEHRPVVEFAKRTWWNGSVSPLPWKMFMNQDTFKGRISTTISLFRKEKSFLSRPIAVFETIMKKASWDNRPKKDSVALIALMNSYFERISNWDYLLKFVRSTEPIVTRNKMYFANFNFDLSRNIISSLLKDTRLPRLKEKDVNYFLFEWAVKSVLLKKLQNMQEKYTDFWLEKQVKSTINAILGLQVLYGWNPTSKSKNALHKKYSSELDAYNSYRDQGTVKPISPIIDEESIKGSIDLIELRRIVRNCMFTKRINYLTLWNESVMTDPKISITRLLELIRQKMNDLMDYTQLDRRFDLSPKLQQIDIDTCSVLKIISDGFNQQARSGKDFDLEGFQKYLRKETNYKDISQMKGIELVSVGYPV
jgi:hypothetical protein